MTDKTAEVKRIVDLYGNKESRPYPYGDLPAAENFIPLQKYPPQNKCALPGSAGRIVVDKGYAFAVGRTFSAMMQSTTVSTISGRV